MAPPPPPLADVISSLEGYAERIQAPLKTGVNVTALRRSASGFELEVDGDNVLARAVVVASGAFQRPTPLAAGRAAPRGVHQMHTSEYRRPSDLPDGDVLVVGSGQSGCEIAQTLLDDQRTAPMAVGRCPWASRRYRGRDARRRQNSTWSGTASRPSSGPTGSGPGFDWIDLPIFDDLGFQGRKEE